MCDRGHTESYYKPRGCVGWFQLTGDISKFRPGLDWNENIEKDIVKVINEMNKPYKPRYDVATRHYNIIVMALNTTHV